MEVALIEREKVAAEEDKGKSTPRGEGENE
jgi:hypothetical protein